MEPFVWCGITPAKSANEDIVPLTDQEIAAFLPYTHYAAVAYCPPAVTLAWSCGENCEAHPDFIPIAAGGDGDNTQFWFVGYDPDQEEIVVSHQGTNFSLLLPVLEDVNIIPRHLNPTLFPGLSQDILVHSGWADHQERTASDVLTATKTGISKFGARKITVAVHSLGAALGLLDAVLFYLQLPDVAVRFVGYALPRVGNQSFADFVDASSIAVTHINNMEDLVPILPGRFLGYHHPSGEVHIQDSSSWVSCPGQDNPSKDCTVGDVPTIFQGNFSNHNGPYQGILMGEC
ncbi:lipase [Trametes elegans]|nr:lipase [Trametes elegans]